MSRNFDFSQAANTGITVLPDLTVMPNPSDLVVVKTIVGGVVDLGFASAAAATGAAATIADTPPAGAAVSSLWWDSTGTGLYIRYNDGNSTQWVSTENQAAIGTVKIADLPPTAADNSLWWDSGGTGLYVRYNDGNSTQWVATQNPYTLTDSPHDGNTYARQSGNWVNLATAPGMPFLPITGGSISTPASLPSKITITPTPPSVANTPNGAQFLSYMTAQFTGGTLDDPIFSNILASTQIQGAPVTGIWALNSELTYQGTGGNGGYVASAGQAVRATTNAGGTANNPQLWGALFNYIDKTNTDSAQANYGSALEIGIACGNTDSANNRRMLGMYLNKFQNSDVAPTCHLGIQIAANVGSFDYMFHAIGQYNIAAFDLRSTTKASGAHTIWLKDGNDIVWNTAATATTYWDSTLFSGAGGIHIDASTMISGSTFYTPNGITTGLVYCTGTASLLGGGTFNGTFAGNHTYSGAVTVSGGLQSTSGSALSGGAAWSSFVLTKDLIVSHNGANPALGILDSTGANGVAITNQGSTFNFYAMPALTDTSTPPTQLMALARVRGGMTLPLMPASGSYANDAAAAGGGVAVGEVYRNGSALMVRVV
jgi:hypothetical protein